jgi:hypothetical protein
LFEYNTDTWPLTGTIRDYLGANPHRIQIAVPQYEGPLFLRFRATQTALTTMTSSISVSDDLQEAIIEGALGLIYQKLLMTTAVEEYKIIWTQAKNRHNATYHHMLQSLGLAQPDTKFRPQRRVAAG